MFLGDFGVIFFRKKNFFYVFFLENQALDHASSRHCTSENNMKSIVSGIFRGFGIILV